MQACVKACEHTVEVNFVVRHITIVKTTFSIYKMDCQHGFRHT